MTLQPSTSDCSGSELMPSYVISVLPDVDDYEPVTVVLTGSRRWRTEMQFEQRGRLSPEEYRRPESGSRRFFDRMAERLAGG